MEFDAFFLKLFESFLPGPITIMNGFGALSNSSGLCKINWVVNTVLPHTDGPAMSKLVGEQNRNALHRSISILVRVAQLHGMICI